ncbi:MAG: hypothetical protein F6K04_15330 [Leptolyngbya sp. SIO4C5]|nr:hypothetical protein [Leptolyngbya sp. SIO4C5]
MTSYRSTPAAEYNMEEEAWWVQQWVDLLNAYRFKKRLERGRRYAREGHILSLDFAGAKVSAKVQGTAPEPYTLSIWIDPFTDEDWNYVVDTLAEKAIFSAQLLAGEMPLNIEAVFTANGLNLFPFSLSDVHSRCSCPDPKNPCKHIAAVYYQLGDFFREDPFVIFQLRGRTKAQILEALRQRRRQAGLTETTAASVNPEEKKAIEPEAAPLDLEQFWQYSEALDPSMVVITPAESTVLDNLGTIPLPAGEAQAVMAYLKAVYQSVAQQAMMKALS